MAVSQRMWKREQERKRRERIRRAKRRRNCAVVVILLAIVVVVAIIMINTGKSRDKKDAPTQVPVSMTDSTAVTNPYVTTRQVTDVKTSFFADSAFAGNALAQTIGMYGILPETDFYAGVNVDVENVYTTMPAGSTTSVAEQFKSKRFDKILLCFGENELGKFTASEFKTQYVTLVEKLKEYQPNARIYLIGIPPITADASQSNDVITMQKIKEYNKRIMSIAVDAEIYYVDSIDALGDNKDFLPKGVSADGINLNKAAVIDLLYYISEEAFVPDLQDLADLDVDEEEDETATPTPAPKPQSTSAPKPSPTVNVFKDSVTDKKKGE